MSGAYFQPPQPDPHDPQPQGWAALLGDLIPLLRRVEMLDPQRAVRLRVEAPGEGAPPVASAFVALPFGVLISRTLPWDDAHAAMDRTVELGQLIEFLLGEGAEPASRDELWRGALPPVRGWIRLDNVADDVVRDLVRAGAATVKELTDRAGDGEQVRQVALEALLDSTVLTVTGDTAGERAASAATAAIPLRTLSALSRMGFLRQGRPVGVDVARGWIRVAAPFGAAYAAPAPSSGAARSGPPGMLPIAR
jgi:hypothetical protein